MLIMEYPFPPSLNTYWRHNRGYTHISEQGTAFRYKVFKHATLNEFKAPPGRLTVGVHIYPPDKRIRDLDNYVKGLLDALTYSKVIEDDSLIDRLVIERMPIIKGGKCRVFISGYVETNDYV